MGTKLQFHVISKVFYKETIISAFAEFSFTSLSINLATNDNHILFYFNKIKNI